MKLIFISYFDSGIETFPISFVRTVIVFTQKFNGVIREKTTGMFLLKITCYKAISLVKKRTPFESYQVINS